MDVLADTVATKLVIHHDVVRLDENGAMIKSQDYENRPRKKKVVEANVTQISKFCQNIACFILYSVFLTICVYSQSKARLSIQAANEEEELGKIRADNDDAHESGHRRYLRDL
jgi:hypothetical protein